MAGITPENFRYRKFLLLAPKYSWWKLWHDEHLPNSWYEEQYFTTVLNKLDAKKVVREFGKNPVLLCYEKPDEFCHRHLIAKWLQQNNFQVKEF